MGRYTGPTDRLSRREGINLFLKGERSYNGKSSIESKHPPGEHGQPELCRYRYLNEGLIMLFII